MSRHCISRALFLLLSSVAVTHAQTLLRYLSDLGFHSVCCMVADVSGSVYVAGATDVLTVPPGVETFKIIVAKLDHSNNPIYHYVFGGSGSDSAQALAVDSSGNLFVVGSTSSADFPLVNPAVIAKPTNPHQTGFISKLDPTGSRLLFSTFLGGTASDRDTAIYAIALDAVGNMYVTGETGAINFPLTPNAYQSAPPTAGVFAFVTKFPNDGGRILYSTYLGDNQANCIGGSSCIGAFGYSAGSSIAVSQDGTITIAGLTSADKFPATAGAFQTVCNCRWHVPTGFVTRLRADGRALVWSTFLGGHGNSNFLLGDAAQAIALTKDGDVVVAGSAASPDFPVTPGAFQTRLKGGSSGPANLFASRLNATGSALVFSTLLGGSIQDNLHGLQLDAQENPWITGTTFSPDFPALPGSLAVGTEFVVQLAADGSRLLNTQRLPNGAAGQALALDPSGDEILLGSAGSLIRTPAAGPSGVSILGQVNAAAYSVSGTVAPGEIVSLYGTGLGPTPGIGARFDSSGRIGSTLGGVRVLFDGTPAPLLYAGVNQINAIVPFEISGRISTSVTVSSGSTTSSPVNLQVAITYPEIFSAAVPPFPPPIDFLAVAAALNQDGAINSPLHPAKPGTVVVFWVNGAGLFMRSWADGSIAQPPLPKPILPISVLLDRAQPLEVLYAGAAPGLVAGVLQVNVRLPQILIGSDHNLQVRVGAYASDPVQISAQP